MVYKKETEDEKVHMDINENVCRKDATEVVMDTTTLAKEVSKKEMYLQQYGWGNFRPSCLQFLNTPKWSLVFIIIYSFCQGIAVLGMTSLVLPSLERRFSFSSKELGIISSSNDISALLVVIFISYYGDYANKIKWMGYGAVITGIGVLLFALPHAMVGDYKPAGTNASSLLCQRITNVTNNNHRSEQCTVTDGGQWYYLMVFIISQLVIGIGNSPFYSLLSPYLDEIVDPRHISTYLGIFYVFNFTAPGLGYLIGGKLLSIYVDIVQPPGQKLSPRSATWIGAWWIGFLAFGTAILLSSVFILGFPDPKKMPIVRERREEHIRKGHLKQAQSTRKQNLREFVPELKELFKNKTFLFSTLAITISSLFTVSLFVFFSKILREKFGMDPESTGYAMSALSVISVLVGNFFGSLLTRFFSLREMCKKTALMCSIIYLLTATSPLIFLIPGCENANLAGVSISYNRDTNAQPATLSPQTLSQKGDQCNNNCRCSLKKFTPVCGSDSVTYLSPCHAGCKGMLRNKTFTRCSCIKEDANFTEGTATRGYCDRRCKNTTIFLAICCAILLIRFTAAVPQKLVTLRCVADDKRAFASGIQYFIMKVFGLLPGPVIFGHLVDTSCRLWQRLCSKKGRCFDYDIDALSRNVCIYGISIISCSTVLYFMAWYFCTAEEQPKSEVVSPTNVIDIDDDIKTEKTTAF